MAIIVSQPVCLWCGFALCGSVAHGGVELYWELRSSRSPAGLMRGWVEAPSPADSSSVATAGYFVFKGGKRNLNRRRMLKVAGMLV
jgi:hypothetical protein